LPLLFSLLGMGTGMSTPHSYRQNDAVQEITGTRTDTEAPPPPIQQQHPQNGNAPTRGDGWFWGGNRDLAFLTTLGTGGRPPPPQVHQASTVRCPVNLNRSSLQLIPIDEANKNKYKLQFMFDASDSCSIQVYYAVTEVIGEEGEPTFIPEQVRTPVHYERGLGQVFEQPPSEYLDTSVFKEEELQMNQELGFFPVVIVITSDPPVVMTDTKKISMATTQTTFAALIHCADDTYAIKPIRQKIRYAGKSYLVHEIFGLENADSDGSAKDCVICMTEPRDTTVLPCRHMCLCSGCAEVLRHQSNKCPICRSTVKSMVEIKVNRLSNDKEDTDSFGEDEEDTLVKKSKQKEGSLPPTKLA